MDALPLAPILLACNCVSGLTPHETTLPTATCTFCGNYRRITRADLDDLLHRANRFQQALAETGICQTCGHVGRADDLTTVEGHQFCDQCSKER